VAEPDRIREGLTAAVSGSQRGSDVADRLCGACVELLDVDGAALSVILGGAISRSYGASSAASRELDELQFTLGEGPCLEAVRSSAPVIAADLSDRASEHWPGFAGAAAERGVHAVLALPVAVASFSIGALDLYRTRAGHLDAAVLAGGLIAAELAALPLLDLMGIDLDAAVTDSASSAWSDLTALTRVEVYQAAGMVVAQLGVSPSEALVRIRGYAFGHGLSASEVAFEIVERRLRLTGDERGEPADRGSGS
jgi:GAF domain